VLVIDGKNNNVDVLQEKHKLRRRSEQYAETRKLRRDSSFQNSRRGPRDGLAGGAKVETREHLENRSRRKSDSGRWITDPKDQQPLDLVDLRGGYRSGNLTSEELAT
jgi:hypothetical protein